MKKQRTHYTLEEKVAVLKHLQEMRSERDSSWRRPVSNGRFVASKSLDIHSVPVVRSFRW